MKFFKYLLTIFIFSWLHFANAAPVEQKQFSIYFNNLTPVPITVGISNLNKTPLRLTTTEIPAHTQGLYIGSAKILDQKNSIDITFYSYLHTGPRSFINTPLINITQDGYTFGNHISPNAVTVDGKIYQVAIYPRGFDYLNAIVVDISQ